ncbi:prolipoprotein diacylglyceryl transferase [Silvibacterium sp.]|uniref:prolipoprotein diacylglyceryl transferase n=1 Tax=Silvibacterium sp. TaxID=1964179 RepID=UPI0039E63C54
MQDQYWVDDLNPWIFHLSNGVGVRWYGLAYILGFLIALALWTRWAKQERIPLAPEDVSTLLVYAAAGVVVGGRLGYCLFYNLDAVIAQPLEIFAIWHGGMSSHGGILGLVLAIYLYARVQHADCWLLLDAAAAVGPLGIALGRIANFVNGELWGRPSTVPWAVIFPDAPLVGGINVPRHPSQIYAAGIEGLLVFAVAIRVFHRQRHSGMTTAAVCIVYGAGRFIDECWRQPDLGQPVFWGWMSKGQLLTVPMILAGILLAVWRSKAMRSGFPAVGDASN